MMNKPHLHDAYLRDDVAAFLPGEHLLEAARALQGEVFREVAGRRTVKVELGGRAFFAKLHEGVGWREVAKNWLILKRPVLGARNEYAACRYLEDRGIVAPRVAAFAESTGIPVRRFSFVLCDALVGFEDLESVALRWLRDPPSPAAKRRLVMQVARFAREFHRAGVAHRDFYICHLLQRTDCPGAPLGVLDLHRALLFAELPRRWRLRDLAALLFSCLDLPLSPRAWLRFVRVYTGRPLKEVFAEDARFWRAVHRRALRLHAKGQRKGALLGDLES